MTWENLSPQQIDQVVGVIRRHTWYLSKLTGRMHQKRFPKDDPVFQAAEAALVAMEKLKEEASRCAKDAEGRETIKTARG